MPSVFPIHLFNPASIKFGLTAKVVTSPPSMSGVTQSVRTDGGGLWTASLSGIVLRTNDQVRAWRAWESELAGGAQRAIIPVADIRYSPRPETARGPARPGDLTPVSIDPYFPEAIGYASPLIVAAISAGAPMRATQVSINIVRGSQIRGGETFSLTHSAAGRRMYRVARVLGRNVNVHSIRIEPPLREAINDGDAVDFDWPSFLAISASGNDISPDIANGRAEVSISFQEAF